MLVRLTRRPVLIATVIFIAVGLVIATQVLKRVGQVDSAALIVEADKAVARQDFKTAGELLDKVLAQDPMNPVGLIARGKLWASIKDFDNALADWRSVEKVPDQESSAKFASEAKWLEGETLVKLRRAPAAERALLQSWQLQPHEDRLPVLEILLRIYVLQMRREEIKLTINLLETYRPLSLEESVLRAVAGAPIIAESDALTQLREFIAGDPEDLFSTTALTRYLMSAEKFAEAEVFLQSVPSKLAQQSALIGLKALCLFRLGNSGGAMSIMAAAPKSIERDYWWWLAGGELAEANQQTTVAADCFGMASLSQPGVGYAHYRYGLALHACGKTSQADAELRIADLINRLHQQTDVLTRLAEVMRTIEMAPNELVNGLLQISKIQHELGSSAEAIGWARMAQQIEPNNVAALELSRPTSHPSTPVDKIASISDQATLDALNQWLAGSPSKTTPSSAQVSSSNGLSVQFEDVHETSQLNFQYFNGNSGFKYLIESMGGGVSVIDFDNDGWPDCYFPQGCKFPIDLSDFSYLDQIYRNVAGQRFVNVTESSRIVENGYSQGTATADINNDGFTDIVVANLGQNKIFINQGDGTFIDQTSEWGLTESEMSSSLAIADFDQDGSLDLYVVNYVDEIRICRDNKGNISTCNPQNFAGVQDRLYQNSGDGRFLDVTNESGVVTVDGKGLGVVATDLDDDGLVDIYVANDTNPNYLFKNLGGMRFQEMGLVSGTALSAEGEAQAGMGIAAGDLDGDLRTDLFVTNFYLESNNVYFNRGEMNFKDGARNAKLSLPSKYKLGFGTQAADIDLDGDLDLIVANGHIDDYTARGDPWKMPTQLFRNLGQGVFEEVSSSAGNYFRAPHLGRGVATLDWNRDGKIDFVVVHQDAPVALLENQCDLQNHRLSIHLIGKKSNRDAIGAKIIFETGGITERRDNHSGDGFYCTNERKIHVATDGKGTISVTWPSGERQIEATEGREVEVSIKEK